MTAQLAPAEVRERDALNYPHDEPCPQCGRRQWTDEFHQETCQACGAHYGDEEAGAFTRGADGG